MDAFTRDTLVQRISFSHDSSLLKPEATSPQPVFTLAPPCPWQPIPSCSSRSFFSIFSEQDFPPLKSTHTQAVPGPSNFLKQSDPASSYLTPPSSASLSKSTIPLPEERGEFTPIFAPHPPGILDSPTVMRREDLTCHKPPTPPPTQLLSNLELPGYDDEDNDLFMDENQHRPHQSDFEEDDFYDETSSMSDDASESDSPLSPLSPPWRPPEESLAESSHWNDIPTSTFSWSPFIENKDLTVPDMSIQLSNGITPFPSSDHAPYLLGVDTFRPNLIPLHIPWSSHHQIHQLDEHSPSSPRRPELSLMDMDIDEPGSPHLLHSSLPELEHEKAPPQIPPSSPSRRSCSCLPEESDGPQSIPSSPGTSLLSLPGADTDDDLLPDMSVCDPPTPSRNVPFVPSQPLLFIQDPRDVPLPRSPSPEDFNLCLSTNDVDNDPELTQLFDLRKRSLSVLQFGPVENPECPEPCLRRNTRRDRERSKEIGALLRLKLGNKHGMEVSEWKSPEHRKKGVIGSISQLVAQMVFRRHDTSRPLTKRKPMPPQGYVQSPLSACAATDS